MRNHEFWSGTRLTPRILPLLPPKANSYLDFDTTVLGVRRLYAGTDTMGDKEDFLDLMYYLLGWFLGDLGKQFGNRRLMTVGLNLSLTKGYLENQKLGDFVFFQCVQKLGVPARRQGDRAPDKSSQYGAYLWDCRRSPLFGWFHLVCLGLKWDERASHVPVKMNWILTAPLRRRLWFIRGLADSDGDVHFNDKSVGITTTPNTDFVYSLLKSVGCKPRIDFDLESSRVVTSVQEAAKISIFNPALQTHRRKRLDKLASARTFMRHWPASLQNKVNRLLAYGRGTKDIRDRILEEDGIFVRLATLKRKQSKYQNLKFEAEGCRGRDSSPRPSGAATPSPDLPPGRL